MAPQEAIASAKVSRAAGRGSHRSVHLFVSARSQAPNRARDLHAGREAGARGKRAELAPLTTDRRPDGQIACIRSTRWGSAYRITRP